MLNIIFFITESFDFYISFTIQNDSRLKHVNDKRSKSKYLSSLCYNCFLGVTKWFVI